MADPCPRAEEWSALIQGHLARERAVEMEAHLETCETCLRHLNDHVETSLTGGDLGTFESTVEGLSTPCPDLTKLIERVKAGQLAPPAIESALPEHFGDYETLEVVAKSSTGIVAKAYDRALDRIVAIKMLAPALVEDDTARARFLREARAAAAVIDDHLVIIHAVAEQDGMPYLVMPYFEGGSLQDHLDRVGVLEAQEVVNVGVQLARGLHAAHEAGLIHRDIKPSNILLENGLSKIRLADFGLARGIEGRPLTQRGMLVGTPHYMSPEQAQGDPLGPRSDLFSVGSVLYTLATGRPPFAADSMIGIVRRVVDSTPAPISSIRPGFPHEVAAHIARLMEKSLDDRFHSASELEAALLGKVELTEIQIGRSIHRPAVVGLVSIILIMIAAVVTSDLSGRTNLCNGAWSRITGKPFSVRGKFGVSGKLREAIERAASGDTIETHYRGSLSMPSTSIRGKFLTIRAASGAEPRFVSASASDPMLSTDSPLILEGLHLERKRSDSSQAPLLEIHEAPVFASNCRFRFARAPQARYPSGSTIRDRRPLRKSPENVLVKLTDSQEAAFNACEFYDSPGSAIHIDQTNAALVASIQLADCVMVGYRFLSLQEMRGGIRLTRNTVVSRVGLWVNGSDPAAPLRVTSASNIWRVNGCLLWAPGSLAGGLHWEDTSNLYMAHPRIAYLRFDDGSFAARNPNNVWELTEWLKIWKAEASGSQESPLPLEGWSPEEDLVHLSPALLADRLRLSDTVLAPQIKVDTIGPGKAYVTHRKTSHYHDWLRRARSVCRAWMKEARSE